MPYGRAQFADSQGLWRAKCAGAVLLALALLALLAAPARADYRSVVLADSPSAYWRLGETSGTAAADQTANANNGTYAGGVTLNQPGAIAGDTDRAARFDGVDDSVNVPDSNSLDMPTGVTVELWVKRTKKAWQILVGKPGNSQNKLENYSVWLDQANNVRAYFGNGTNNASIVGTTALDTNWHYVAATYDNATAKIYIDGVLNATKASGVKMAVNAQPLSIGRETAAAANFFGGTLDEVAVFDRALTAAQLKAHFDATVADTTAPVVTLAQPANGSSTGATPPFNGAAGTLAGDSTTVTVKIYSGSTATGIPVQTLDTTRTGATWAVFSLVPLLDGTYTARAEQSDAAGNTGLSGASTFTVDTSPPAVTLAQPSDGTTTSNPRPAYSGGAGSAAGDAATVTVKVYAGSAATGTPVQTLSATRSGGAWAITATAALADGTYTARAEQADAAGNLGLSSSSTFAVDTTAPGVTLTQPAPGSSLATATPHLAGAAGGASGDASLVTVDLYAGSSATGTPLQSISVGRSGAAWSADPAELADGTYTARASQADAAGNAGRSAAVTFSVDTAAPVVTLTQPANGAATTDPRPAFTGAAESGSVTVKVFAGASATGTPVQTLAATGPSWSVTPALALSDGTYTARAEQTDAAGNTGTSAASTFSVDATAPVVTLTQPAAGSFATTATPHLAGAAGAASGDSALVTVDVYAGASATGTPVQSLTATRSGGAWGIDAAALAEGTYTARATQTDDHGNTGHSAAVTFTVDTAVPVVTLAQPAGGSTVADARPQFAGTAESGSVTVKVYAGTTATGTPVQTLAATGPSWSVTPVTALADGTYTARAEQTDAAGHTGLSATSTFTVDGAAPAVTLATPADGSTTSDPRPAFSGSAESGTVTVKVYAGTSATGTPVRTLTATGPSWSVTPAAAFADGTYTARAEQTDGAGNTGHSNAATFTIDTAAPSVTLTQPADGATTSNPKPPFAGTAESGTVTVKVYAGTNATGTPVQTLTATGPSWSVTPTVALADGTYTARAEQTDAAGNTGHSALATFTIDTVVPDTTPPTVTIGQPADGSTTNDPTPPFTGTAGDAAGDSATVTLRVYAGGSATGSPLRTVTTTRAGTAWSAAVAALADGVYTARAQQDDAAGNHGFSAAATFTVNTVAPDTTPPAVTLTQPADGSLTGNPLPAFAGAAGTEATDGATVTVKVYAGSTATGLPVQTLSTNRTGGSWTVTPLTPLLDATYTARAEQSDTAGNTGQSGTATFTVDTTAPAVTLSQPAGGAVVGDPRPAFAGAADGSTTVTVKVYAGGSATGTPEQTLTATPSGGAWTVTPALALGDGTHTARAEQTDAAGNTGRSAPTTFSVDTAAPAVTLAQPADGSTTANAKPPYSGSAESGTVTVKVYAGTSATGTPVQTLTATGPSWNVTPTVALADGTYTARAEQTDGAGNTGRSAPATFTVDAAAPAVTLMQPAAGSVTGNARPTYSGGAESGTVTVKVYAGATATGTPVQTLGATGPSWSVVGAVALADGTYTARAEQTDGAGNTGQSAAVTFTVDTAAPAVTLSQPADGTLTSNARPPYAGTAESGTVTVKVYAGTGATGTPVQTLTATGPGWSVTPAAALADGTYTARAEQTDAAGNTGRSAPATFTVDTAAPAVTLAQPADGSTTNDNRPAFSGAGDGATTVTVKVYAGASASGTPVLTLFAAPGGGTWTATPASALADGTYTARAEQTDAAGNTGLSAPATFTVNTVAPDTSPPAVTLTQPADGSSTANRTPAYAGVAGTDAGDDATVTVKVYAGTSATGTPVDTLTTTRSGASWTVTASAALTEGTYTARAEQGDAAGNTGHSAAATFTVDAAAPAVTLTQPPDGSTGNDNRPPFAGAAGTDPGDSASIALKVYAGTSANGAPVQTLTATRSAGAWAATPALALADGTYTARAEQADAAGNTGYSGTRTFTIDTAAPAVTLTQPANGVTSTDPTPALAGAAGTAGGDSSIVTARIYAGTGATGTPVQTIGVTRTGASWTATPAALADGTYTARAEQTDAAGNTGRSVASTFTVAVPPPINTAYRDMVLADNPRGYWRLGEASGAAATDSSTNANTGTYVNGVALGRPGTISGDTNTAVQLDGVNDSISVPDASSLDLTSGVTIEAWVKRSKAGWQVIAGKSGNGQSRLENYSMWFDSGNFLRGFFGNGTTYATVSSAAAIDTNWHHLVATYDNATARLYVDGNLNASATSGVAMAANADPFIIGRDAGNTYFLGATVDDVAVYASPLSANRIRSHYDTGTAGDTTGPAVALAAPADGSFTSAGRPTFSGTGGTATGDSATVTVKVYAGQSPTGTPVQTLAATRAGAAWSVQATSALAAGTYTARAEQTDSAGNTGLSAASTFTVDMTAPGIDLSRPTDGSTVAEIRPTFAGEAGAIAGDSATVTVKLYAGTSATGTPLQTIATTRSDATWLVQATADLAFGTYTVRAQQSDAAGNTGFSNPATFTVADTPPVGSSGYHDEVMTDSPRAFWRLGESSGTTAADQSGNNNAGSYVGGVALGQAGRIVGDGDTSANFDGVNDYMTVPDSASLDVSTGATVETWMKRSKSGWQVVVGKPGNGQSRLENYAIWIDSANFLRAFFGDGTNYATVSGTTALDTNWHHVVATYDNATVKLYIDGVIDASSASTVHLTPNASVVNVGREVGNTFYYGGRLDDVAVYGSALSAARIQKHFATGNGIDTTPPVVTLSTPSSGSSTIDTTPAYAGQAAITGTDSSTVTVKVYSGSSATGTPVQTLSTTKNATGSWAVSSTPALALGTYTAQAEQSDVAGNVGTSTTRTFSITTRAAVGADKEFIGAGDIAFCDDTGDEATALLLDQFPSTPVFTLGDNAYETGTTSEFNNCYQPTWGRAKARTRPALGDHDYADGADPNAAGYFTYFAAQLAPFGASATDPARGYYSFDLGAWHVVVLNPQCGDEAPTCSPATQVSWLQADLAAHPASCTAAMVSAPRWSSGSVHGNNSDVQNYWAALVAGGVDLYLAGDDHDYERFAPQNAAGAYDPNGLRQIVVGTGGRSHYPFAGGVVRANSEVRNDDTYGILRLVLRPTRYEWEFVPQAGRTFIDSGSDTCH